MTKIQENIEKLEETRSFITKIMKKRLRCIPKVFNQIIQTVFTFLIEEDALRFSINMNKLFKMLNIQFNQMIKILKDICQEVKFQLNLERVIKIYNMYKALFQYYKKLYLYVVNSKTPDMKIKLLSTCIELRSLYGI